MLAVTSILSAFLLLATIILALKEKSSYFSFYISAMFGILYVIAPVANWYFGVGIHPYYAEYFVGSNDATAIASLIVLVFFSSYFFAFKYAKPSEKYYFKISNKINRPLFIQLLFFFSLAAFLLYLSAYGGLAYALENASRIRSGSDDNKSYAGAFIKMFTYYIEIVLFYCYARIAFFKGRKKVLSIFIFTIILCIAIFKSMTDGGRGGLINIIVAILFIALIQGGGRIPKFGFLLGFFLAIFVGLYGKTFIFQMFSENATIYSELSFDFRESVGDVIREYAHQYSSIIVAVEKDLALSRFYSDYFIWAVKPLKLLGFSVPDSISYFNTYQVTGVWDSEIPPGFIALNYFQGGVLGVVIAGFVCGYIVKLIDGVLLRTINSSNLPISYAISAVLYIYLPFAFLNSDPALFLQWFLAYAILFGSLLVLKKIKIASL